MKRHAVVAGQFYPSSASELDAQISSYLTKDAPKEKAIGIMSPHAGIIYSGQVAGTVFSRIDFPRTFILLGPNHTGYGQPVSLMSSGKWEMPAGSVSIDENLARKLAEQCEEISHDNDAHAREHSLEVQLPFIMHYRQDVQIVPLSIMADSLEVCRVVGNAIADVIKETEYSVTIIASSDMSHYEKDSTAREKDRLAIERITNLDPEGLYSTVRDNGISMCGVLPVTTMLFAANKIGARESSLVKYMTSGDITGDYDSVVGYAGIIIT